MQKRVYIALAVLLVVIAGVSAWHGLRQREPVYQGKTLSGWLQRYITSGSYLPEPEADEAVRQIGTNAIPTLMHMLRARDSKLKLALMWLSHKQQFIRIRVSPAAFSNWEAAVAFHALGDNASIAVPQLIQVYRDRISLDSQGGCVEALGWIGPAASEAIPDLMSAATNLDNTLRAVAVGALGRIHAEPKLVLPLLTKSLQDSNIQVRHFAVSSLARFGVEAKPAVGSLTRSLNEPHAAIRTNVAASLKAIDPEAAAKAGVK